MNHVAVCSIRFAAAVAFSLTSGLATAITITPNQNASALTTALLSGANTGIVVTGTTLSGHQDAVVLAGLSLGNLTSSGTYTNSSGTYGIGSGVVISTGGVEGASFMGTSVIPGYSDGLNSSANSGYPFGTGFDISAPPDPNDPPPGTPATGAQELLLDPITGDVATQTFYDHFDVTELVINFDMQPGFDRLTFNIVFGSEEFPEFVGNLFVDGFGMFLNGINIAQVGGLPININHPGMSGSITGTELDGILAPGGNPVLTFSGLVNPTGNTLRFIVADTSDGILDTTVYFSALEGVPQVPLPGSLWLLGSAAAGLVGRGWSKRRSAALHSA